MDRTITVGEYIVKFCIMRGISVRYFAKKCKYDNPYIDLSTKQRVTITRYFAMAEYMSKLSGLPEEFYLKRLKQAIKGELKCRDLSS